MALKTALRPSSWPASSPGVPHSGFKTRGSFGLPGFGSLDNDLDAVAVRVQHIGRVVVGVVLVPDAGRDVVFGPGRHRGGVKGIDDCSALCDERKMNSRRAGLAALQPEEEVVLAAKSHEVGMAVLAPIVEDLGDSERHEGLRVEGDRTG